MNYINAYLYIPVKEGKHRGWGELSGSKVAILKINNEIIQQYQDGVMIEELAKTYFLSTHAIRKILYQK